MKTLKLRIEDKPCSVLNQLARQVNFIWNYSNALCFQHLQRTGKFFSAFDLHAYPKGTSKAGLDLHSQSIQAMNEELVLRRKQFKKSKLRWRVSGGSRKSLGWIPFKASSISYKHGQIKYARSVLDAGWTAFRTLLKYKCKEAGVWFEEVNEKYSTQTCSCCGSRRDSPKGRAGLGIREWTCGECGITHDRDVNAALNILALGHERLVGGITASLGR
jgi:hypothetical protein